MAVTSGSVWVRAYPPSLPGFGFLIRGAPRGELWLVRRHFCRSIQIRFDPGLDQNLTDDPLFYSRKLPIKRLS